MPQPSSAPPVVVAFCEVEELEHVVLILVVPVDALEDLIADGLLKSKNVKEFLCTSRRWPPLRVCCVRCSLGPGSISHELEHMLFDGIGNWG